MELEATGIVIHRIFYRQLSANLKIKNDKIKTSFVSDIMNKLFLKRIGSTNALGANKV